MLASHSENQIPKRPADRARQSARCRRLAIALLVALLLSLSGHGFGILAEGTTATAKATTVPVTAATTATSTVKATTAPVTAATTATSAAKATTVAGPTVLLDTAVSGSLPINGKAYALYETQSGTFLLGRNADAPLSPASITKVMTVLLALEKMKLTDSITVTKDMYATIPNDYVRLGLIEGELISVEEVLYACLLISANDAAMALGLTMGGTVSGFADMMNARARQLGCTGTTFTNPYGLADPKNLTTAHDMALMMAELLKNETYTKIATTKNHLIPATNKIGTRGLTNGNRFVSTAKYAYAPYIGGKTGFTNLSGYTIVAGARKNGRTLVGVILGATASEIRYDNLLTLFNHGFADYSTFRLDPASYETARTELVAKVESQIKDAGLQLKIAGSSLDVSPFASASLAKDAKSCVYSVGICPSAPQAGLASQVLEYPLLLEYKDGVKSRVGTLSLTLQEQKPSPVATKATAANSPAAAAAATLPEVGGSVGAILLRIGGIALAIIALAAIVIFILMQRELKRRRARRRRPNIRRL